jgi:hypothetical protein
MPPFLEEARIHMRTPGKAPAWIRLQLEPRVTLQIPEAGKVNLLLRIPVPSRRKGRSRAGYPAQVLGRIFQSRPTISIIKKDSPDSRSFVAGGEAAT